MPSRSRQPSAAGSTNDPEPLERPRRVRPRDIDAIDDRRIRTDPEPREKLFESLVSREEMAKAVDEGRYYRIPADNRDLNYAKYFVEGETSVSASEDYTSHNTTRLERPEVIDLLLKLDYVQEQLRA